MNKVQWKEVLVGIVGMVFRTSREVNQGVELFEEEGGIVAGDCRAACMDEQGGEN